MNNSDQPAFPVKETGFNSSYGQMVESVSPGLTKRELIAAMCMQGLLANTSFSHEANFAAFGRDASAAADALLEALNKGGQP